LSKKYTLSSREKFLITFLLIVITVFSTAFFLFMPAMERRGLLADELEMMRSQYEDTRRQADQALARQALAGELREELQAEREKLNLFVNIETIEREFTQYMLLNGMVIQSVAFSDAGRARDDLETLLLSDIPLIRAETGGGLPPNALVTLTLTISVRGDNLQTILGLTDYINDIYSYRLMNININQSGRGEGNYSVTYTVEAVLRTD
jgi:hypothetical protein